LFNCSALIFSIKGTVSAMRVYLMLYFKSSKLLTVKVYQGSLKLISIVRASRKIHWPFELTTAKVWLDIIKRKLLKL
jgi:hypothetical protein